ncbi:unnamed protein product (mitochondrion) [Plasmodiophora brassicae]|uniref:Cell cycle checkpoint control protein n=1 Tax=Plasmodiophora brassicae TaxID=37360 RepID=A0A0G4J4P0_PLABS|nr:hypothetical protein PBRA_002486 [Plasmodiophora brassicae]SPQ93595.1 unnamed protein product [Plasmodiophora brassicae]
MDSVIDKGSLQAFSRALQCIGRTGAWAVIEVTAQGMTWRALNDAQSAYALLQLAPEFFASFQRTGRFSVKCRVSMKTLLWSLRPRFHVDCKSVRMRLDADGLIFELTLNTGVGQRIQVAADEVDGSVYSVQCDRLSMFNNLSANPKVLSRVLGHFHANIEDITLLLSKDEVVIKSYLDPLAPDGDSNSASVLQTAIRLRPDDFDRYHVGDDPDGPISLTFPIKEIRSMVTFCEAVNEQLFLYCTRQGDPVLMSSVDIELGSKIFLNCAVATIAPDERLDYDDRHTADYSSIADKSSTEKRTETADDEFTFTINGSSKPSTNDDVGQARVIAGRPETVYESDDDACLDGISSSSDGDDGDKIMGTPKRARYD